MSFACGIAILLADQWIKRTMQSHTANLSLGGVVRFHAVYHHDKIFERTSTRVALVLTWMLAVVCAAILHLSGTWFSSVLSLAGLGLALGGAASNLLDILQLNSVVNFIDLGWWPVFNLADAAIVAGLAGAFFG